MKKQERKATESYYPVQPPSRRGYYTVIAVILMLTVALSLLSVMLPLIGMMNSVA